MREKNTFYDEILTKSISESTRTRTKLRLKHLEQDGLRKLSDILNAYYYVYSEDLTILVFYLNKGTINPDMETLRQLIEENISNPEINWPSILKYFEERLKTETDWGYSYTLKDITKLIKQYEDQIPSEYSGFVLY